MVRTTRETANTSSSPQTAQSPSLLHRAECMFTCRGHVVKFGAQFFKRLPQYQVVTTDLPLSSIARKSVSAKNAVPRE